MKFQRAAAMALAAGVTSASAFTVGRTTTTFMGRSVVGTAPSITTRSSRGISSTGMTMIFDKFFGGIGGGGAQAATIPYENLDHPGPELAKYAEEGTVPMMSPKNPNLALATFAGGCFWGLELAYMRVPGVVYTAVGYSQGPESYKYPNYSQVCSGSTGHTEAVMVYYDPTETSYETLLDTFFGRINPTTVNGQGNDRGTQYRTGVYFHSPEQEAAAVARFTKEQVTYGKKPIATEMKAATAFWPAEKYHQQYLEKGGQNANKGAVDTIRCYG
jgi:peptide-methionine (S)-S-oxide reductase